MKVYIAGSHTDTDLFDRVRPPYLLESFYYIDDWHTDYLNSDDCESFMLDSGAFTFMQDTSGSKSVDWDEYLGKYIQFINDHDIERFFELDIDSVVGYDRVRELRDRLERETGKQCIPVWHKSRGKEAFLDLCEQYDYIALGGIAGDEFTPSEYKYFPWFIDTAHEHDTKIHGLGYTPLQNPEDHPFDSVDSTSWLFNGSRFGKTVKFTGTGLKDYYRPEGKRCHDTDKLNEHNLSEWMKYVDYIDAKIPGLEDKRHSHPS